MANSLIPAEIVVVDDEVALAEMVCEELQEFFTSVRFFTSSKQAAEELSRKRVDCVITDFRMPVLNGVGLIKELKKVHPTMPIIMLTGNGNDPEVTQALEEGMFDYLDKPFRTQVLVNRIKNALILPKLESLVLELARVELGEETVRKYELSTPQERITHLNAIEAILRTRLLNAIHKKRTA